MSIWHHVLAAAALWAFVTPAWCPGAVAESQPPFQQYSATETFAGKPARLDTSHPIWKAVPAGTRDMVRSEIGEGVNFAGAYRLVMIGCGTACRTVIAIDLRNGRPHIAPVSASAEVAFREDSRLIVFEPDPTIGEPAHFFVLDGGVIVEVEAPRSGVEPTSGQDLAANMVGGHHPSLPARL
jgi:hypothetical protein